MSNFENVKKFMKTSGRKLKKSRISEEKIISLRYELIKEELSEFKEAIEKRY